MEQMTTVISSLKSKYFVIFTLTTAICLILLISIFLLTMIKYRQSSSSQIAMKLISKQTTTTTPTTTTTTFSPEEFQRLSAFKEFLNLPINYPNPNPSDSSIIMNKFMRSVYHKIYDTTNFRRKRRHNNFILSDQTDFIISLPNYSLIKNEFYFEYNSSLDYLTYVELILPIHQQSIIHISSSTFNISINQTIEKNQNWLKINLTKYIKSFPLKFNLIQQSSSGFLTLYFRRSPTHSITRRDLSSFYDNQLITYPDDPSYCQVRPLRTSFSELNWSSWILEPRSYEMNICSGTCYTRSNMGTYFIIQNLLNQKYPKQIPAPCCKPKRFSSTMLLYYDGPNLVLKRHENMRVVECGCSS